MPKSQHLEWEPKMGLAGKPFNPASQALAMLRHCALEWMVDSLSRIDAIIESPSPSGCVPRTLTPRDRYRDHSVILYLSLRRPWRRALFSDGPKAVMLHFALTLPATRSNKAKEGPRVLWRALRVSPANMPVDGRGTFQTLEIQNVNLETWSDCSHSSTRSGFIDLADTALGRS